MIPRSGSAGRFAWYCRGLGLSTRSPAAERNSSALLSRRPLEGRESRMVCSDGMINSLFFVSVTSPQEGIRDRDGLVCNKQKPRVVNRGLLYQNTLSCYLFCSGTRVSISRSFGDVW